MRTVGRPQIIISPAQRMPPAIKCRRQIVASDWDLAKTFDFCRQKGQLHVFSFWQELLDTEIPKPMDILPTIQITLAGSFFCIWIKIEETFEFRNPKFQSLHVCIQSLWAFDKKWAAHIGPQRWLEPENSGSRWCLSLNSSPRWVTHPRSHVYCAPSEVLYTRWSNNVLCSSNCSIHPPTSDAHLSTFWYPAFAHSDSFPKLPVQKSWDFSHFLSMLAWCWKHFCFKVRLCGLMILNVLSCGLS